MNTEFWVDMSFDPLTDQEAQGLKDAGVKGIMQCLWTGAQQPPYRVINLRVGERNGLDLMGYGSLPTGAKAGHEHAASTRAGVPDDLWNKLLLVPIDVELDGISPISVREMVEDLYALEKRRCIYTSWNAWRNKMGNPTTFTDCLLYNALWDKTAKIDFSSLPYGNWTIQQVVGEQYSGGTYVAGQYVDLDTFVTPLLRPSPVVDPCGLPKLMLAFYEECTKALAEKDYATLIRWGKFLGS